MISTSKFYTEPCLSLSFLPVPQLDLIANQMHCMCLYCQECELLTTEDIDRWDAAVASLASPFTYSYMPTDFFVFSCLESHFPEIQFSPKRYVDNLKLCSFLLIFHLKYSTNFSMKSCISALFCREFYPKRTY